MKPVINVVLWVALGVIVLVFVIGVAETGDARQQAADEEGAKTMQHIDDQVADDAVRQYEIAKRSGTKMDACVQAGFVAAAYLQAKNEAEYASWKKTEGADCEAAGMPAK